MKNALFAVVGLLALSLVPVSGHAAAPRLPGEKCGPSYDSVQIGTTTMADDKQNIIACLLTGDTTPGANISEWKAMTSSGGGGGITGGCRVGLGGGIFQGWGKGCSGMRQDDPCLSAAEPGYLCGTSGVDNANQCICVKK